MRSPSVSLMPVRIIALSVFLVFLCCDRAEATDPSPKDATAPLATARRDMQPLSNGSMSAQPITTVIVAGRRPCLAQGVRNGVLACIHGHPITLAEVDHAGGHTLHEALEQVYSQRTLALYHLVSRELLDREAKTHHLSVDDLLEQKVYARVPPPSEAEVNAFLKERTGNETPDDPARVKQAAIDLNSKRRAEHKREYIETLFKAYNVRVSLETPPPASVEEIQGPLEPAIGAPRAGVTLVVFSDYLCPFCRDLSHTIAGLLKEYPKDLRVVYRQFPIHPNADRLAQAALCANEQGQFANYHALLFDRSSLSVEDLVPLAEQAGLDRGAFSICLASDRFASRVTNDLDEGKRLGIAGTPTLFVNGIRVEGNPSAANLDARIAAALHRNTTLAAVTSLHSP
jgi:predicted DsbA family dithiol-disulfide isomerase